MFDLGAMVAIVSAAAGGFGVSEGYIWVVLSLLGSVPFRIGDLSLTFEEKNEVTGDHRQLIWQSRHSVDMQVHPMSITMVMIHRQMAM